MQEQIKEQIKQRVIAWKKIFTEGRTDVNENSTWTEILRALSLTAEAAAKLITKAMVEADSFSTQEGEFLYSLPFYSDVIHMLETMPNENIYGNQFSFRRPTGDAIYCLRYPKVEENQDDGLMIIEATIVTKEPVDFDSDTYEILTRGKYFSKQLVIKYAAEPSEEFKEEERKFLESQPPEAEEPEDIPEEGREYMDKNFPYNSTSYHDPAQESSFEDDLPF